MSGSFEQTQAYDAKLVTLLETLWGPGYLSPGGDEETAMVLSGLELTGKRVLDIGCGTGGCLFFMAGREPGLHGVGVDVEAHVIAAANGAAASKGLSGRIAFQTVSPGPLPFADGSFDLVFSKDAIVHIEDKHAVAGEIFRVLKPGGAFAASDWMAGADGPLSPAMLHYNELEGLGFGLASPDRYFAALRKAGFGEIAYRDRTAWYAALAHRELGALRGPLRGELIAKVGQPFLDHEIEVWEALSRVLDSGELGPGHWRAVKAA